MAQETERLLEHRDPVVALIGALVIPGGGHLYIGQARKAFILCIVINVTILAGLWMGHGQDIIMQRVPWFIAEIGGGIVPLVAALRASRLGIVDAPAGQFIPLYDIGTVYCAVAGMLNMLAAINALAITVDTNAEIARRRRGGAT